MAWELPNPTLSTLNIPVPTHFVLSQDTFLSSLPVPTPVFHPGKQCQLFKGTGTSLRVPQLTQEWLGNLGLGSRTGFLDGAFELFLTSLMRISATSMWLLRAARCRAVNPSSFLESTSCRALARIFFMALQSWRAY